MACLAEFIGVLQTFSHDLWDGPLSGELVNTLLKHGVARIYFQTFMNGLFSHSS